MYNDNDFCDFDCKPEDNIRLIVEKAIEQDKEISESVDWVIIPERQMTIVMFQN